MDSEQVVLRRGAFAVVVAVSLLGFARSAHAQQGPWAGDRHDIAVFAGFTYAPSPFLVETPTKEILNRPTDNDTLTVGGVWVPIENLELEVQAPFEAVRYTGTVPHTPVGKWDDGKWHYTPGDLRISAGYQILDEPYLAIMPYVAGTFPMANYQTIGFATAGRNLDQAHFGLSAGRSLSPLLRHLILSGTFEFTLSETYDANAQTNAINQNRVDWFANLSYVFLDGDLIVGLAGTFREQLGGIEFTDFRNLPLSLTDYHDPILKEMWIFYGFNVSYRATRKLTVDAIVREFLHGYNTRFQDVYSLNLTWHI
jgi:hypothetical protein